MKKNRKERIQKPRFVVVQNHDQTGTIKPVKPAMTEVQQRFFGSRRLHLLGSTSPQSCD